MTLSVGQSLSHYEILGPLGAGGMGVVYRARDTRLERDVAIKVLPEEFADDDERLRRFEREAKALASLNHANVAQVFGIDQDGDTCFMAMELVPGEDLAARLSRGALSVGEAIEVCTQIAEGVEAAHEAGVIHRDLKPANVRITPAGRVKVLDFGLAKPTEAGPSDSSTTDSVLTTEEGRLLGTPTYMAPEQARGKSIDKRVDVWAFGCVLFECLTGRRAFEGETLGDVLVSVLEKEPDWSALPASTPERLKGLLERCLHKESSERMRDVGEARILLLALISARDLSSRAVSPQGSARRNRLVAVGLGLVAVVGLSMWQLWPKPPLQSLAVLPFINESDDEDASFLCDGIPESIINRLATVPGLRVVPSSTSIHFRGTEDLDRVAKTLNVRAILTGRLTRQGDELMIRVSLDDVLESRRLWGEPIRARVSDVFEIEREIADGVAEQLRLRLTGSQQARLATNATTIHDAHLAYMRGRHLWWSANGRQGQEQAVSFFEEAIELDPKYALPYCGLVDSSCILAAWGVLQPLRIRAEMQARVDTALALDAELAEAHVSAGLVAMYLFWDWDAAEKSFRRAITLNADLGIAYLEYGRMLAWVGRYDDAEGQYRRGIEANPISPRFLHGLGMLYSGTGRLAEAEEVLREALELDADHHEALIWLGSVKQRQGEFDEAVAHLERAVLVHEQPELALLGFLGNAYAMAGRMDDARDVLTRMRELNDVESLSHLFFAEIHAALGDVDEAFVQLSNAVAAREAWLPNLRFEPGLVQIRDDPRFVEIHRKMGLGHVDLSLR